MKHIFSLIAVFMIFCAQAADVFMIKDGKANLVIVVEDHKNPILKMAGEELAMHLQKRTGLQIPILKASAKIPAKAYPIYLGLSERTKKLGVNESKLKYDGYCLKVTDKYMVIAGRDKALIKEPYDGHTFIYGNKKLGIYMYGEKGTLHGVYKLLEKYAGVRHYMPGELGSIIPESKNFSVPEQETYVAPAFITRGFTGIWFDKVDPKSPDFLYWHHRMCAGGDRSPINHSYRRMRHFQKTNPEYFALIDGQRDFKKLSTANPFGNLCMTNKEGIKAFTNLARKFFDKYPEFTVFPVVPQDGLFKVCECPDCKKLHSPHLGYTGQFSNIVFHHAIEMAKELRKTHPDKVIGVLAYSRYRIAPEMEIPDNMHVCICYRRQDLRDPVKKKEIEDTIKAFAAKKAKIQLWTYPIYNHIPQLRGLPIFYPAIMKENILFNLNNNVIGEKAQGDYRSGGGDQVVPGRGEVGIPFSTHLNDYVRCQLLWDPHQDVNAMLDEYYQLFFGPAAAEMKKFWQTAEELFMKRGEATVYTKEDIELFEKLLAAAVRKVDPNTVYGKRVIGTQKEFAPFFKTMKEIRSGDRTIGIPIVKDEIPMEYSKNNVWKYARKYRLVYKSGNTVEPSHATNVYVLANKKGIGLYLEANEPDLTKLLKKTTVRDDPATWRDDGYEIFFVSKDRSLNLHYMITAGGNIMDGKRDIDIHVVDWDFTSGLNLKQTTGKNAWNTIIFFPWKDLNCTLETAPELLFQIYRRQTRGATDNRGVYQVMFSSTAFHNYSPEYFGGVNFLAAENLLKNGSFEQLTPKGEPMFWSKKAEVTNQAADGKNGIALTNAVKGKDSVTSDPIPVVPGKEYVLYFRQKGAPAYAYVLFYDAKNKRIIEPGQKFHYSGTKADWTRNAYTGKVPKGAVTAKIMLRSFEKKPDLKTFVDHVEFYTGK